MHHFEIAVAIREATEFNDRIRHETVEVDALEDRTGATDEGPHTEDMQHANIRPEIIDLANRPPQS
jgi:hypothetical protein